MPGSPGIETGCRREEFGRARNDHQPIAVDDCQRLSLRQGDDADSYIQFLECSGRSPRIHHFLDGLIMRKRRAARYYEGNDKTEESRQLKPPLRGCLEHLFSQPPSHDSPEQGMHHCSSPAQRLAGLMAGQWVVIYARIPPSPAVHDGELVNGTSRQCSFSQAQYYGAMGA